MLQVAAWCLRLIAWGAKSIWNCFFRFLHGFNEYHGFGQVASAAVAAVAIYFTVSLFYANERSDQSQKDRAIRASFLSALQAIQNGDVRYHELQAVHKDSEYLGTMQAAVSDQNLLLLLQAENLLPEIERLNQVSEKEYIILARESGNQGNYDKARVYAQKVADSTCPYIKAAVRTIFGEIKYREGSPDAAGEEFYAALRIYDESKLLREDKAAAKLQVCVGWTDLEIEYGFQQHRFVEDIITLGKTSASGLKKGSLKESADKFFASRLARIKELREAAAPSQVDAGATNRENAKAP